MPTNQDFRDLFAALNDAGAEYLVVGAHALAAHGHVRATKDLDVWVHSTTDNAQRVLVALRNFGAPLDDLTVADLSAPEIVYQMGVAPVRIDILTSVDGITFEEAWSERVVSRYGDQPIPVLSRTLLIKNKLASGRLQDLADVEQLGVKLPVPKQ